MRPLSVGSLFSGVGMFDLALERAGMRVIWQCEYDKTARSVLKRHWPDVPIYEDIRKIDTGKLIRDGLRPDVIVGGWPCTDLSVAGQRAGLSGEHSGLWYEMLRVVDGLRPEWIIGENVPNLFSSWTPCEPPPDAVEGCEWEVEESSDLETVLLGLTQIGYRLVGRVLDGQYFSVAQRRERVFFVCHYRNGCAAKVLLEPESLRGDFEARRAAREDVAGTIAGGSGSGRGDDGSRVIASPVSASAGHHGHSSSRGDGAIAYDGRQITSPENRSNPTPNGVCDTLHSDTDTLVVFNWQSGGDQRLSCGDKPTALQASETPAIFEPRIARNGRGAPEPVAPPLKAQSGQTGKGDSAPCVTWSGMRTRRLTPRECERLQGLPDDHTRYGADSKEIADGPRYRMIGNGGVVPLMEWIGRRIAEQSE